MNIEDQVVVVTGAGRGIGWGAAEEFGRRGAKLALLDLSSEELQSRVQQSNLARSQVRCYACDVSNEAQIVQTFESIARDFGRLDVLINNAGITRDALLLKVENGVVTRRMSLDQWRKVIDVNLTGVFLSGREAAAHMVTFARGGVIVNVSSISRAGNVGQTNYTAAKAGVAAMTVVWARELARYGIRAASIAPGFTRTEMVAAMKPEALEKLVSTVPLRRSAEVDEIVHAMIFAVENEYFTGRCIEVDGGLRF